MELLFNETLNNTDSFTFLHPLRHNLKKLYLYIQSNDILTIYHDNLPMIVNYKEDESIIQSFDYFPKFLGIITGLIFFLLCRKKKRDYDDNDVVE